MVDNDIVGLGSEFEGNVGALVRCHPRIFFLCVNVQVGTVTRCRGPLHGDLSEVLGEQGPSKTLLHSVSCSLWYKWQH